MTNNGLAQKPFVRIFIILAALAIVTGWSILTPSGVFGKLDAVGYAVCHRIDVRSFFAGSQQLPLCARCSGMYLGAVAAIVFQLLRGSKSTRIPHWSVLVFLALFTLAFGIDGGNSYLALIRQVAPQALPGIPTLYEPNNTLRLLTGTGMGLAMAVMLFPAFNQTMWREGVDRSVFPNLKPFAVLVAITLALVLLTLTESPIVLYPLAFITIFGVLLLLAMVYAMVWVLLMRQDNTFTQYRQLWLPMLAGFTIAMIQTAGIDFLRYGLTGTWGAFPLGPAQ